ncbi:mitochondrial carrier protein MTM1-like [Apium graveolens]|uniref:mitochondrial carrier protein MTM1-like n=1 Tax=Apium graveolens TaxID=4045 RepID=UPI003D7B705F
MSSLVWSSVSVGQTTDAVGVAIVSGSIVGSEKGQSIGFIRLWGFGCCCLNNRRGCCFKEGNRKGCFFKEGNRRGCCFKEGNRLGYCEGSEEVCVPQNKVVNDKSSYGGNLGLTERAFSAAGAAFLSAIIVNPLDLAKEGILRLWRGTNAGLALAVPTVGIYLPCYDIFRNYLEEFTAKNAPIMTPYTPLLAGSLARSLACISCYPIELAKTRMQSDMQNYCALWTGLGAQLARDVPFSAICWGTLEPTRRRLLSLVGEDSSAIGILGANFSAGFVAGSLAAAATCPLDVAKMRRQIEKDPTRALRMTTRQTLVEIWRYVYIVN